MTGGDEETDVKQHAKVYKRMPTTKKDKLFHLTGCTHTHTHTKKRSRGEEKNGCGNEIVLWTYNYAIQIAEENTEKSRNNICK